MFQLKAFRLLQCQNENTELVKQVRKTLTLAIKTTWCETSIFISYFLVWGGEEVDA